MKWKKKTLTVMQKLKYKILVFLELVFCQTNSNKVKT